MNSETIHIPQSIRFSCSGCGNCCLSWPVPLTAADRERIERLDFENLKISSCSKSHLRSLNSRDARLDAFAHTLEKDFDGRCQFLTQDNRCVLHASCGESAKPSMCSLFPFSFCKTPDGIHAYVSFASSAVLLNSGELLSSQSKLLSEKWQLFQSLYPGVQSDWSSLQLVDGLNTTFADFIALEQSFLEDFCPSEVEDALPGHRASREQDLVFSSQDISPCPVACATKPIEETLFESSSTIASALPPTVNAEAIPPLESSPSIVDQLLLKHMDRFYFPSDIFRSGPAGFDARALMEEIVQAPDTVLFGSGSTATPLSKLAELPGGALSEKIDDLLRRFVYCRLFARLYCGPSLAHLSVLSGFHHLLFLVVLIKLKIKDHIRLAGSIDFPAAAEYVRSAERRLSQLSLSRQTASVWEVLFLSPARAERVLTFFK